jgi:hypothetical protein
MNSVEFNSAQTTLSQGCGLARELGMIFRKSFNSPLVGLRDRQRVNNSSTDAPGRIFAITLALILQLHPSRGLMVSPTERWSAYEIVGEVLVSAEETLPRGLRPMHLKTSSPKLGPSVAPEERG